jgi:rod shape-determining protein MreC
MRYNLWDRVRDWVLLAVLLLAAGVVVLARNEPVVYGLRAASLDVTSRVEARLSAVGRYVRALDENTSLREENIVLSSELARSREAVIENRRLHQMMTFRDTTHFSLQPARIVSKDITRQQNLLTIDVGSRDGVEVEMPVVNEMGIIGKVVLVSERYARVMPYLNTDFRTPAKVQPMQAAGIVRWEGDRRDRLLMEHVVKTEVVQRGHLVVTSGYSSVFPGGYPIGVVDSVFARPGRNELVVYLTPTAYLDRAEHVFVIMTRPDSERIALEATPVR